MKKVLILDTNVASFPIYEYLVNKGFDVYVMGGKSTDCLAKYTPNYINFDYSNIELLKEKVKEYNFDFIIPGSNDVSYLSIAKLNTNAKYNGIDTIEVTETINNKLKFRKFAIKSKLNVPKIFNKEDVIKQNKSVIIKPVDAYSGRGVTIVNEITEKNIELAIDNAITFSNSKNYVIEEFIEGQLYSHTAFIKDKKVLIDFIVIENGTTNKFTVDTSYVVHDFNKNILLDIRKDIEKMSQKLQLVDGLVHTQFIKTNNSFKILEVTRRCPGDLYSLLIKKSTGFDYAEYYTKPFISEDITEWKLPIQKNSIVRHTLSTDEYLRFIGFNFEEQIHINLFIPLSTTGDEINKSPFGRIGLLFIDCKTYDNLIAINNKILNRKFYKIK